jgi:hypothetical protein
MKHNLHGDHDELQHLQSVSFTASHPTQQKRLYCLAPHAEPDSSSMPCVAHAKRFAKRKRSTQTMTEGVRSM